MSLQLPNISSGVNVSVVFVAAGVVVVVVVGFAVVNVKVVVVVVNGNTIGFKRAILSPHRDTT